MIICHNLFIYLFFPPERKAEEYRFKGLSNTQSMKGTNLASGAECVHKHNMLFDVGLFLVLELKYLQRSNPDIWDFLRFVWLYKQERVFELGKQWKKITSK